PAPPPPAASCGGGRPPKIAGRARGATHDWCASEDEQGKADYLASLPKADRVDFYADFILRGEAVERVKEDILRPGTRVIGDAFVRALRLVKRKALAKYRLSRA
ncbi:MAG: hypothetical protein FWG23_08385, partial [Eggerthellaceae bacterium]|nr:hypothetical protein [Eggerthellaceae bacterium]